MFYYVHTVVKVQLFVHNFLKFWVESNCLAMSHCDPICCRTMHTFVPPHVPPCIEGLTMLQFGLRAFFSTMPIYSHDHIRKCHLP